MLGTSAGSLRGDDEAHEVDPEVEAIAQAYVEMAQGNVRLALSVSVADRIATARLVSRGFARWGQPMPRRCLTPTRRSA